MITLMMMLIKTTLFCYVYFLVSSYDCYRAMLSNPPLNYGPDLGAASADPVETENYEALLNLGKRLSFISHILLYFPRSLAMFSCCCSWFDWSHHSSNYNNVLMTPLSYYFVVGLISYSRTVGRSKASRIGSDADRSTAIVSIFWRDRRRWSKHLRHLHVRIRNPADATCSPL